MPIETTDTASVDASVKKAIQKLQRAIVDGLEDVKAQDIQVFDTEHLSPLFERVVIASGNTNRQTRALAASVRDAVREAGFDKPRIEGEENGEWIIVDCGSAVVHIMQPAIRQYYTLEQIWGEKPVRMRIGKAPAKAAPKATGKTAVTKAAAGTKKTASATAGKAVAKIAAKTTAVKTTKATAAKTAVKASAKTTAKKPAAKPATVTKSVAAAKKTAVKKTAAKASTSQTSTARKAV
ncbi:MAG: ribosome silencing factor [Brachymonas sp.]|nr:ribosome silencing factor [Brachymonas sp.]